MRNFCVGFRSNQVTIEDIQRLGWRGEDCISKSVLLGCGPGGVHLIWSPNVQLHSPLEGRHEGVRPQLCVAVWDREEFHHSYLAL